MSKNAKAMNEKSDESSLGILNMENLKIFGEISGNSSSRTSERLNIERFKAFETLQKSQQSSFFKKPQNMGNKENLKSANNTPKLNHTEYVPFCRPNTINISDLVSDKTIHLESSSSCTPTAAIVNKDVKISFEPAEITGRSTLYHKEQKKGTKTKQQPPVGESLADHFQRPREVPRQKQSGEKSGNQQPSSYYTVEEILASSQAPKVRNLCETLRSDVSTLDVLGGRSSSATTSSTSFTNYNVSRSLPRTADMSYGTKESCTQQESFNAGSEFSFMKGAAGGCTDDSAFSAEDFAPGELMQSKLLNDEIAWAQEYAAIPSAALSEQAKAKASIVLPHGFDSPSVSNSILASDPNFSLGNFFNMRSEDIRNIVMSKSPDKARAPIALVDESRASSNSIKSNVSTSSLTPKIDNRTYSKMGTSTVTREQSQLLAEEHESKDSGNATDNSYLLSMSAIDRALCNLDIHQDDSGAGVINEILKQSKKSPRNPTKSSGNCVPEEPHQRSSLGSAIKSHAVANGEIASIADLILANKENLDPQLMRGSSFSDTLSLTESFLDSTDMKQLQRSSTQPRSPLSPLNIPNIQVTEADREADVDEWPSTPIKSPNRRVRRTKSPVDMSPACSVDLKKPGHISPSTDTKTPVNPKNWKPKSLCSTRLDEGKNSTPECDFGISPNLSKSGGLRSQTLTNGSSPAPFDCSPMSSPMSSHASSPSGSGFRSPRLDSTTNSERRCLTAGGGAGARKAVSSPVTSESGASGKYSACAGYGLAPMRSCSTNSMKSGGGVNGAAGRSVSRCSNSSEFSHRDGKVIPLKVTTLELSWGSTKLRTDVRKSMQVKNIANKRLVVRIEIQGPGFQIVNTQSNMLTLQSQECRSIIINFCPTITGTAIGMLSFYSPLGSTTANMAFLEIPLFGYGGHCNIQPQNILKGPVGSGFLPMGDLCELSRPLERTFKIHNKGPLLGFAIVCIDSLGLHLPRLCDTFEVSPQCMLIPPGKAATVRVVFRPKRDDIKKIIKKISNVLTLANMRVMCGDEPNRQRMRRLVQRMGPEERSKIVSNTLDKLWTVFPDELEMTELAEFREKSADVMDLLTHIRLFEIALTLNHDNLDESAVTSSLFFPDADETVLFRTVCHAASPTPQNMLDPVDELLEEDEALGAVSSTREGSWSVSPTLIEFDFDSQRRSERVSLLIRNSFKSRQYFEVVCNHKDLLSFTPSEGYVEPDDGQIEVEVHSQLDSSSQSYEKLNNEQIMVMIYMENERITVPVKVIRG